MLTRKYNTGFWLKLVLLAGALWMQGCFFSDRTQLELQEENQLLAQRYDDSTWKAFLNVKRDKDIQPERVIELLDLRNGNTVADIGAGSGYFTFRLARAVGPQGIVYALDIQPEGLVYIRQKNNDTHANPYNNIYCIINKPDDTCLLDESLDLAFLCDVHFYRFSRLTKINEDMIRSIFKAVKAGGRLAVIEKKMRHDFSTSEDIIRKNFEESGFKFSRSYKLMNTHFFLIFQK